jgi:hypothetical protein
VVDRRACPQSPPGDDHQPDRGQDGHTEHHPTARRADITLGEGQQRRGEEPIEGDERRLVDQEAEPVALARWLDCRGRGGATANNVHHAMNVTAAR